VLHPSLPDFPGHDMWKRDFSGCNGLVSIALHDVPKAALDAMLDGFEHFAMGYSWGGYESLVIPFDPNASRTVPRWPKTGPYLRLHCGLEDADDLIEDLEKGFDRLAAAS